MHNGDGRRARPYAPIGGAAREQSEPRIVRDGAQADGTRRGKVCNNETSAVVVRALPPASIPLPVSQCGPVSVLDRLTHIADRGLSPHRPRRRCTRSRAKGPPGAPGGTVQRHRRFACLGDLCLRARSPAFYRFSRSVQSGGALPANLAHPSKPRIGGAGDVITERIRVFAVHH